MTALEEIVEDLKGLPPAKLEEAAALIRRLQAEEKTQRDAALRRSAAILSPEEGADLERVITETFGKVDPREW